MILDMNMPLLFTGHQKCFQNEETLSAKRFDKANGQSKYMSVHTVTKQNFSPSRHSFPLSGDEMKFCPQSEELLLGSKYARIMPDSPDNRDGSSASMLTHPFGFPTEVWQETANQSASSNFTFSSDDFPELHNSNALTSDIGSNFKAGVHKNLHTGEPCGKANVEHFKTYSRRRTISTRGKSVAQGAEATETCSWRRSNYGLRTYNAFFNAYHSTFIDTHCHLDFLFNREPFEYVLSFT